MNIKKPKVLIVDDDARNLRLMEAMIAPMEVQIYTASSGNKALEMIAEIPPDVILLDIMMPGMDGIEVCRRLKENRATRNIPVVFVTAATDTKSHAAAVEAGGVGFITKPVQDILVEASVKSAIHMKQLSDEIEDLIRQRAKLTNMIVHDIKNLLTVILGYTNLLLLDNTLPAPARKGITAIEKSGKDIHVMTSNLLEVEKLESGTLQISLDDINAWNLVKNRAQLLISQAVERGIRLELLEPEKDIIVRADQNLLSRIFDNIIINALKFCPNNGVIEISASDEEDFRRIAITNDGPPIPREYHEKIFEKFAQVETRQAFGPKGVGLGLAFCKMAIEAMNGKITVESPVTGREDGVSFIIHLPAVNPLE